MKNQSTPNPSPKKSKAKQTPITTKNKTDPNKLRLARKFRKKPTAQEKQVWEWLRDRRMLGLKFRRQQIIDGYIADFYCAQYRFVLEIDGPFHEIGKNRESDRKREDVFREKGIRTYRIANGECTRGNIRNLLTSPPGPLSMNGEGE